MTDLARTLDALAAYLRGYVVMSPAQTWAVALWTVHTHAFEAAESTPYLHVTSAERESGKSRLLEALELVVARPLKTGGTTAAALARAVAQDPAPTFMLDEADNGFKRDREYVAALMGILNDGYRRGGRTLLCLPPKWTPSFLPVFAPKAVAGIGDLPDTLQSRSIRLELKRRAPGERVDRFRRRDAEERAEPIRISIESLAAYHVATLAEARPELPDELGDRAMDTWEPLVAIADLAGGEWPQRARRAAVELSGARPAEDDSIGVRLLADIHQAFADTNADRLSTAELLARLHMDEEAPWGEFGKPPKPLSARGLSRLLRRFGIRPRTVRLDDGTTPKGYHADQFEDAWKRYLAHEDASKRHNATTGTVEPETADFHPPQDGPVADTKMGANPHGYAVVADVADRNAGIGDFDPDVDIDFGDADDDIPLDLEPENSRPILGDEMYPILIAEAVRDEHITEAEAELAYSAHKLILLGWNEL